MADSYLERVAGEIAEITLADQEASGDITIVDQIATVLGASSQTLEEAFLTAVRVRRAETRARALLAQRMENNYAPVAKPAPAPMQYEDDGTADDTPEEPAPADTRNQETAIPDPEQAQQPDPQDDDDDAAAKSKIGMPRRVTR